MTYDRKLSMMTGVLILSAFGTWGGGNALAAGGSSLALPVLFATAPVVLAIGVLAYVFLSRAAPVTAVTYLATRGFEAALLSVAAVLLVADGDVLRGAAHLAYLVAMAGLGIGSIPFCLALFRLRMVPGWLALWGAASYGLFAVGMIADMGGLSIGHVLLVPGGLFEIALAVWLVARGLDLSFESAGVRA